MPSEFYLQGKGIKKTPTQPTGQPATTPVATPTTSSQSGGSSFYRQGKAQLAQAAQPAPQQPQKGVLERTGEFLTNIGKRTYEAGRQSIGNLISGFGASEVSSLGGQFVGTRPEKTATQVKIENLQTELQTGKKIDRSKAELIGQALYATDIPFVGTPKGWIEGIGEILPAGTPPEEQLKAKKERLNEELKIYEDNAKFTNDYTLVNRTKAQLQGIDSEIAFWEEEKRRKEVGKVSQVTENLFRDRPNLTEEERKQKQEELKNLEEHLRKLEEKDKKGETLEGKLENYGLYLSLDAEKNLKKLKQETKVDFYSVEGILYSLAEQAYDVAEDFGTYTLATYAARKGKIKTAKALYALGTASQYYKAVGNARNEALKNGATEQQADNAGRMYGVLETATIKLGVGEALQKLNLRKNNIVKIEDSLKKKILNYSVNKALGATGEVAEELTQDVIFNAVQETYMENPEYFEGADQTAVVSTIFGLIFSNGKRNFANADGLTPEMEEKASKEIDNALKTPPEKRDEFQNVLIDKYKQRKAEKELKKSNVIQQPVQDVIIDGENVSNRVKDAYAPTTPQEGFVTPPPTQPITPAETPAVTPTVTPTPTPTVKPEVTPTPTKQVKQKAVKEVKPKKTLGEKKVKESEISTFSNLKKEAKKYKNAEEFVKAKTKSHYIDIKDIKSSLDADTFARNKNVPISENIKLLSEYKSKIKKIEKSPVGREIKKPISIGFNVDGAGGFRIYDGNHRYLQALKNGDKKILVKFVDTKSQTNNEKIKSDLTNLWKTSQTTKPEVKLSVAPKKTLGEKKVKAPKILEQITETPKKEKLKKGQINLTEEARKFKTPKDLIDNLYNKPFEDPVRAAFLSDSIGFLVDKTNKKYGVNLTPNDIFDIKGNKTLERFPKLKKPFEEGELSKFANETFNEYATNFWQQAQKGKPKTKPEVTPTEAPKKTIEQEKKVEKKPTKEKVASKTAKVEKVRTPEEIVESKNFNLQLDKQLKEREKQRGVKKYRTKKDLIIITNTRTSKVDEIIKDGVVILPSMAVTKSELIEKDLGGYGEVTFVGDSNFVKDTTFFGDIYSTRMPTRQVEINDKEKVKLTETLKPYMKLVTEKYGYSNLEGYLMNNDVNKSDIFYNSLTSNSIVAKYLIDEKNIKLSDNVLENLKIIDNFRKEIQKDYDAKDYTDFKNWVENNLLKNLLGKEYFITNSGRRKPFTPENLLQEMKGRQRGQEKMAGGGTSARLKGFIAKSTSDIKKVQEQRQLIKDTSKKTLIKKFESLDNRLNKLIEQIHYASELRNERFYARNLIIDSLGTVGQNITKSKVYKALQDSYVDNPSQQLVDTTYKYLIDLQEAPVGYFEIKPQRLVPLSEFKGAVVPNTMSAETISKLENLGLVVKMYDPKIEGDRARILASNFDDIKFRTKDDLTTRLLKEFSGVDFAKKQTIQNKINELKSKGLIRDSEIELLNEKLKEQKETVDIKKFKKDIQADLMQLTSKSSRKNYFDLSQRFFKMLDIPFEQENYQATVYEMPYLNTAGSNHFNTTFDTFGSNNESLMVVDKYFGHVRSATKDQIRFVFELQSDFFQKIKSWIGSFKDLSLYDEYVYRRNYTESNVQSSKREIAILTKDLKFFRDAKEKYLEIKDKENWYEELSKFATDKYQNYEVSYESYNYSFMEQLNKVKKGIDGLKGTQYEFLLEDRIKEDTQNFLERLYGFTKDRDSRLKSEEIYLANQEKQLKRLNKDVKIYEELAASQKKKLDDVEKNYKNINAHKRLLNEELFKAAEDGITTVYIPMGSAAFVGEQNFYYKFWKGDLPRQDLERLVNDAKNIRNSYLIDLMDKYIVEPDELKVGDKIYIPHQSMATTKWEIALIKEIEEDTFENNNVKTSIKKKVYLRDSNDSFLEKNNFIKKFAFFKNPNFDPTIPASVFQNPRWMDVRGTIYSSEIQNMEVVPKEVEEKYINDIWERNLFSVDTENKKYKSSPLYKLYENELSKYAKKNFNAQEENVNGVKLLKIEITPEIKKGIEAFRTKDDVKEIFGVDINDSQEKEIEDLHKYLFNTGDVKFTLNLMANLDKLAFYKEQIITIFKGQAKPTDSYLHEAVHFYIDNFLTPEEKRNLFKEAFKKYKFTKLDLPKLEELVAEDLIDYANKRVKRIIEKRKTTLGKIQLFFERFWERVTKFNKNYDAITELYENILTPAVEKKKKISKLGEKKAAQAPPEKKRLGQKKKMPEVVTPAAPVGEGKVKKSRFMERLNEQLLESNPEAFGFSDTDGTYNVANLERESERAINFIEADPMRALRIALGNEDVPAGYLENTISVAVALRLKQLGNYDLYKQVIVRNTLQNTRRGQEIASLRGQFNNNSPENYIKQALDARINKLGEKFGGALNSRLSLIGNKDAKKENKKKLVERIQKEKVELKKTIRDARIKSAQDVIDSLRC